MAYSNHVELTALTGTTLSIDVQTAIIAQADREIDAKLYMAGLTPPGSDDMLKAASLNLSKVGIITHNRMIGAQTNSTQVGDIAIGDNLDMQIKELTAKAWASVVAYVVANSTTTQIPGMAVVGRLGRRVGTYEEMT